MNYKFVATQKTEQNRYLYSLAHLYNGAYGVSHFYVLPKLTGTKRLSTVLIPMPQKLPTISQRALISKLDINVQQFTSMDFPKKLDFKLMPTLDVPTATQLEQLKNSWQPKADKFEACLKTLFPQSTLTSLAEVVVILTNIGSLASYSTTEPKAKRMYVAIRSDADISHLAECIITSLIRFETLMYAASTPSYIPQNYIKTAQWLMAEHTSDFLMSKTKLSELFPKFTPTLKAADVQPNSALQTQSLEYLRKLGVTTTPELCIKGDLVYITTQDKVFPGLTNQEQQLLLYLIDHKNIEISYDELAKVLWKDRYLDKFSLNAISKLFFTIRSKLGLNNISNVVVETIRNRGYVLRM